MFEPAIHAFGDSTSGDRGLAVGWRKRADVEVDLSHVMQRKGVQFATEGVRRAWPVEDRVELETGRSVADNYPVIAIGP